MNQRKKLESAWVKVKVWEKKNGKGFYERSKKNFSQKNFYTFFTLALSRTVSAYSS